MSDTNTNEAAEAVQMPSWQRNSEGLLDHVKYERNPDGSINWRKMVKPEFLVLSKQALEKRKGEVPETLDGVDDKELLILLGGIKDLARLRGYVEVDHKVIHAAPTYCAVKTTIVWTPNFETGGVQQTFTALADATSQNTQGFAKLYLMAIAENRGFVRAVRNYLGINVVGQDEVGAVLEEPTESGGNPNKFLKSILDRHKVPFERFKNKMAELGVEGAENWEEVKDVPSEQVHACADLVLKLIEQKKAEKAAKK